METKARFRSFLAALALFSAFGGLTPLDAQSPDESAKEDAESSKSVSEDVPPIPEWTPSDPETRLLYEQARKDLDEDLYDAAEKAFKKLRSKARGTPGEATIDRCLKETRGGKLCEKAGKYVEKSQHRKIIALWKKEEKKVTDTFTGEELRAFFDDAMAEVYFVLADFETKKEGEDEDDDESDEDEEEDEDDEDDRRRGGDARGRTEYGANTRMVKGDPKEGEVREGEGSLYWQTTNQIGFVTIQVPEEVQLEDFRYLNISFRTEVPKAKPPVTLIFDCESGNLNQPGGNEGGGRRGARRGARAANAIRNRVGFHGPLEPKGRWQDLRIDLRKLEDRGNARWQNVLNLRLVHMGVGEETGIFIDQVILEKP